MSFKIQVRGSVDSPWLTTGEDDPILEGMPDIEYPTFSAALTFALSWCAPLESDGLWRVIETTDPSVGSSG